MKKQIENTVVALALILGLIFAAMASSSLLPVFAQTNQTSSTTTTQATALASPITTFSANGDISSLIFVTQKPINATINSSSLSNATKFVLSGDALVVLYGKSLHNTHIDLISSSMSITAKLASFAQPNEVAIGQSIYNILLSNHKLLKGLSGPILEKRIQTH